MVRSGSTDGLSHRSALNPRALISSTSPLATRTKGSERLHLPLIRRIRRHFLEVARPSPDPRRSARSAVFPFPPSLQPPHRNHLRLPQGGTSSADNILRTLSLRITRLAVLSSVISVFSVDQSLWSRLRHVASSADNPSAEFAKKGGKRRHLPLDAASRIPPQSGRIIREADSRRSGKSGVKMGPLAPSLSLPKSFHPTHSLIS
jgi:hypothetical protein